MPSFFQSFKDALNDRILAILAAFATLSLLVSGIYEAFVKDDDDDSDSQWWAGASIYLAILILVLITTVNDYAKDKQFV